MCIASTKDVTLWNYNSEINCEDFSLSTEVWTQGRHCEEAIVLHIRPTRGLEIQLQSKMEEAGILKRRSIGQLGDRSNKAINWPAKAIDHRLIALLLRNIPELF